MYGMQKCVCAYRYIYAYVCVSNLSFLIIRNYSIWHISNMSNYVCLYAYHHIKNMYKAPTYS